MRYRRYTGFTLVELAVVMSIIGILVVIGTVGYKSQQRSAKSDAARSLALQVKAKAELWKNIENTYPTYTQLSTNTRTTSPLVKGPFEARLDNPTLVTNAATTNPTDHTKVGYRSCTIGAQIEWYDSTAPVSQKVRYIGLGGASSTAACS